MVAKKRAAFPENRANEKKKKIKKEDLEDLKIETKKNYEKRIHTN